MNLLTKFLPVNTLIFDMDGVLTDGGLLIMPDGEWIRRMHVKDGYALQLAVKSGYQVLVISGSSSVAVEARLNKLGIQNVYQHVKNKQALLLELMKQKGLQKEAVMFMGDDVPDLEIMQTAGVSCCPADACRDILEVADYISPIKGGEGCVRDVIEKIMRLQGKWTSRNDIAST